MNEIKVFPIGKIENENDETKIFLNPAYRAGLKGLGEYSHAQVLWWMAAIMIRIVELLSKRSLMQKGRKRLAYLRSAHLKGRILSQCPMLISYMWMSRPERLACPTWMLFRAA